MDLFGNPEKPSQSAMALTGTQYGKFGPSLQAKSPTWFVSTTNKKDTRFFYSQNDATSYAFTLKKQGKAPTVGQVQSLF